VGLRYRPPSRCSTVVSVEVREFNSVCKYMVIRHSFQGQGVPRAIPTSKMAVFVDLSTLDPPAKWRCDTLELQRRIGLVTWRREAATRW
jgi:hypothetical protein